MKRIEKLAKINRFLSVLLIVLVIVFVIVFFLKTSNTLSNKVTSFEKQNSEVMEISVYVRDLNTGKITVLNPEYKYTPASMFKVPTVMAILKASESRDFLKQEIFFDQELRDIYLSRGIQQYPEVKNPLVVGETYTIQDLIYRSITESDNESSLVLNAVLPLDYMNDLMSTLGVSLFDGTLVQRDASYFFTTPNSAPYMSTSDFAKIIESLYNASYLNKENSDFVLSMLSSTNFHGIDKGVPEDIRVASKFGIYDTFVPGKQEQQTGLNECGIVYTESPYSVCIMFIASDFDSAEEALVDLSELIYSKMK